MSSSAGTPDYEILTARPRALALYNAAWPAGRLDVGRGRSVAREGLQFDHIECAPVYLSMIRRGDPSRPSDYDNVRLDPVQLPDIVIAPRQRMPNVTLFADFGRVLPGTFQLQADFGPETRAWSETGEALQATRSYPLEPHGEKPGFYRPSIRQGGWGSFRFIWVHLEGVRTELVLRQLSAIAQLLPVTYHGRFASGDDVLNRVWEMCAYSVHCTMGQPIGAEPTPQPALQTLCLDRVDRHPWAGDSRVIQTAALDVFGEFELVRASLDRLLPRGQRPIPDLNTIPAYTLDWGLAVVDYFRCSGDTEYLLGRLNDLVALARTYDGPVPEAPGMFGMFFDWDKRIIDPAKGPGHFRPQTDAAFTGKYVQLCQQVAWASSQVQRHDLAAQLAATADRHSDAWRETNRNWAQTYGLHAVTCLILGGVLGGDEYATAFDAVFADRRTRYSHTPYFGNYVLEALARMGRHEEALSLIADYWGTMIAAGATTVWEEWDPSCPLPVNAQPPQFGRPLTWGGLSLIQPAGAGPARWLMREVLGVYPASPGYAAVRVRPHALHLGHAAGSVATPHGEIGVKWRSERSERFTLEIRVPEQCATVELHVPLGDEYLINGQLIAAPQARDGRAVFIRSTGGSTAVEVRGAL
jgi:hypothetical protein